MLPTDRWPLWDIRVQMHVRFWTSLCASVALGLGMLPRSTYKGRSIVQSPQILILL